MNDNATDPITDILATNERLVRVNNDMADIVRMSLAALTRIAIAQTPDPRQDASDTLRFVLRRMNDAIQKADRGTA